ncbi:uncharacterized, partial [Tachysurus ichikawai]
MMDQREVVGSHYVNSLWFGDGAEEVVGGSRQQWVGPAPKTLLGLFHAWKILCNTNTHEAVQINLPHNEEQMLIKVQEKTKQQRENVVLYQ